MKHKKFAFTMSEVLITLGVIGVVAAMTLSPLIENYQKTVWVKQLQKNYSTINQAFKMMLADDGVEFLSHTKTFNSMTGSECRHSTNINNCRDFYDNLEKYIKISSIGNINYKYTFLPKNTKTYTWNQKAITLANGAIMYDYYFGKNPSVKANITMKGKMGFFYIDINGKKKPNKVGRDAWRFVIDNSGIIYPDGSEAVSEQETGNSTKEGYYWKTSTNPWYSCNSSSSYGQGCTARVLEEGKMNY